MTSPMNSNLLQQTVDAPRVHPTPEPPMHTRHVTHVVAQPQPMPVQYAPQPQVVYAAPSRAGAGALTGVMLALIVILLGAVALVAGYFLTKQSAPSVREQGLVTGASMREGFRAGRARGIDAGRADALSSASTTTALRAANARQQAYNKAFQRGERAGRNSYRAPRYTGYRGGYSYPRIAGVAGGDIYSALGTAQSIANVTGAPVDVEIY